jgi:tetratricopeptide (TPR) repeat protein
MASLAAMFTLLGILFYLKARMSQRLKTRIFCACVACIAFVFAVASKENTVLFPIALLLLEWAFFNDLRTRFSKKTILICLVLFIVFVGLLGIFISGNNSLFFFLKGYENRPFTLTERLLTEPRIIIFYLSQIVYPVTTRLSITHDINLSTSLISPWTTLPAILIILSIIIFAFTQLHKRPWLGFPLLFYFLYHLIESTIIPLELIFEHRNYLPTFFLFLPVSIGIYKLFAYYDKNSFMYYVLSVFLCLLLIIIGLGTYSRNLDWKTNETLWKDAVEKAPNMARPLQNLANCYYRQGKYNHSIELNKKAIGLYDPKPKFSRYLSYYNIAGNYLKIEEYQKAIPFLQKAIQLDQSVETRYRLCVALIGVGDIRQAKRQLKKLVAQSNLPRYINLKSILAFKINNLGLIEKNCKQILRTNYKNRRAIYYLGLVYMLQKEYLQANHFLNTVRGLTKKDIGIHFSRIENSVRAGNTIRTRPIVKKLLELYTVPYIYKMLDKMSKDRLAPPIDKNLVRSAIEEQVIRYADSKSDI